MTQPCTHTPGLVRTVAHNDERRAPCTGCGVELSSLFDDYDGDGEWHWTRWQPAPIPVVVDLRTPVPWVA